MYGIIHQKLKLETELIVICIPCIIINISMLLLLSPEKHQTAVLSFDSKMHFTPFRRFLGTLFNVQTADPCVR